jgi:hypothetical protein
MTTGMTVTRQDAGDGHTILTRSDGEVFHLLRHDDWHASLYHGDKKEPYGIGLDAHLTDTVGEAEKLVLAFPIDWPPETQ